MSACNRLDLESLRSLTDYAQKYSFPNTVTRINARVSTSGHEHPNDAQVFVCFPPFRNEVEMVHGELCNYLVRRVGNGEVFFICTDAKQEVFFTCTCAKREGCSRIYMCTSLTKHLIVATTN